VGVRRPESTEYRVQGTGLIRVDPPVSASISGLTGRLNVEGRSPKPEVKNTVYPVLCTLYSVPCTLYSVPCTLYSVLILVG
jgi:hypothetical protein